ncbi:MAG: glycoside hydrolase family 9 protein [Candidatus Promineifilaceae bacterium]
MSTKRVLFWCALLFSVTLFIPSTIEATDRQTLPELPLFTDKPLAQWVGAGNGMSIESEVDDNDAVFLPLDATQSYQELPSYRVRVSGENGWWSISFAGRDWEPFSLAPYAANGFLEFNIKSSERPAALQIGISDINFDRDVRGNVPNVVPLQNYIVPSKNWQTVRIPLSNLLSGGDDFRLSQIATLQFSSVNGDPQLFWLNNIRFTSDDYEPTYPAIKVNQLGYLPSQYKVARVSGFDEVLAASAETSFEVRKASDNTIVHSGNLELVTDLDPVVSGERVLQADFSDLTKTGRYYLAIGGFDRSPVFEIKANLYDTLLKDSLRYFYLQRAGVEIDSQHGGEFARAAGHLQDRSARFKSQTYGPKDVSGGWYDAGDYGKYTNAGAVAVSDLLWTYEMFSDQFSDRQLNIPEGGNGVPDILDEVRWELDWILKMQDENTGGFYHAIQDTEDAMPAAATAGRVIEDVFLGVKKDPSDDRYHVIPTSTSGSAIAALAHGALVFAEVDPEFSQELLTSAEFGWQYLVDHPQNIPGVDGPYRDNDDHDDRFWAAAELYRATGDSRYHDYVRFVYKDVKDLFTSETDNAYGVGQVGMLGWLAYMHSAESGSDGLDEQLSQHFEQRFEDWSAMMMQRHADSAWNLTLLDEDFYWGSNYVMLTTPFVLAVGQAALGDVNPETQQVARDALDYILGTNPLRFSFVSGYGSDRVDQLFSIIWRNDGLDAEPAGVMAGGANDYTNPLMSSNFAAKQYVDSAGAWSVNEHTVYWNSTLAFNVALAMDSGVDRAGDASFSAETLSRFSPLQIIVATSGSILSIVAGIKVAQQLTAD